MANNVEATSERMDAVEYYQSLQDRLAHATNEEEREDAQRSLDQAQTFVPAWDRRIEGIESDLAKHRATVKAICDGKSSLEHIRNEQVLTLF